MSSTDRRLYAQFTLDFADSHKIAPLSDAAFRTYVRMVLWSRRMMTDGKIPAAMARTFAKPKVIAELCTNDPISPSLQQDEAGDYYLHDFLEHQQSRAQIEARQATNRANGARGGQAKANRTATESVAQPPSEPVSERLPDSYTESETETTTKTRSTRPVVETAASQDDGPTDEADRSRREGYWRGWNISNPLKVQIVLSQAIERPITEDQAILIVAGILAKAKTRPDSIERYVLGSIRQSWAEIQQELDEAAVAA